MKVEVIAFGIAREIFKSDVMPLELKDKATIADLRSTLEEKFPSLSQKLLPQLSF